MTTPTGREGALPPGDSPWHYLPIPGRYDELQDSEGAVRPGWRRFWESLTSLEPAVLGQREEQARRLLRENGVTYNVYGAAKDLDRPWLLDPLPVLMMEDEWSRLAAALRQRLRLLNLLARDLYGSQQLLRWGILPGEALHEHPGYLLPCHGMIPPDGIFLNWYAAQLARDTTGEWRVLGDRTQGPSGAGYAVENRLVVSRTLPQDFHSLNVVRLASYFLTLKNSLSRLGGSLSGNPRIVVLTPGPRSSRFFEDVYLSRYLGYTLVEGGDLTVRGEGVFLKTLGGLLPVHVILRRLADSDCDPLELRPDSYLGVPALTQAVRSGQVLVVNPLGGGVLEAPILQALLPRLCRHLLSEELQLRASDTWWCGLPEDRLFVESHLQELLIRPAFQSRGKTLVGWQLSSQERSELLARIRARPTRFIAQRPVEGSTVPVWSERQLQPWHLTLRTFAVYNGEDYDILPGGLCRVAPVSELLVESMAAGQRSKDLWILSEQPVKTVTLLRPHVPALQLRRSPNDLPSRAADYLFWLGRLTERAEGAIRHLRGIVARMTTEVEPAGLPEMRLLVSSLCDPGQSPLELVNPPADWTQIREELWSFLTDANRLGSLAETLESARRTASVVRDRVAIDAWRILHQMELGDVRNEGVADPARLLMRLNQLLILCSAFSGLAAESMTRGPGWLFLDMGRRIERALHTLRVIRGLMVDSTVEPLPCLEAILEIADSSMTYRYRYLSTLQLAPVLDLILVDETNPRSVIFQMLALGEHARRLEELCPTRPGDPSRLRATFDLLSELRLADIEALCDVDRRQDRDSLARRLDEWSAALRDLSEDITHAFLSHTVAPRQLTELQSANLG
ncbi:MAG: circularly permuted type 2 ATP-grasp protein [Planctomycetaceae bacterium]|jgi:uncharacterized circularly permuted ATP-grasp superfamily protein/uncharacterized alpha-E superfamily protein